MHRRRFVTGSAAALGAAALGLPVDALRAPGGAAGPGESFAEGVTTRTYAGGDGRVWVTVEHTVTAFRLGGRPAWASRYAGAVRVLAPGGAAAAALGPGRLTFDGGDAADWFDHGGFGVPDGLPLALGFGGAAQAGTPPGAPARAAGVVVGPGGVIGYDVPLG